MNFSKIWDPVFDPRGTFQNFKFDNILHVRAFHLPSKVLLEASDFFGNPIAFTIHADHVLEKDKVLQLFSNVLIFLLNLKFDKNQEHTC